MTEIVCTVHIWKLEEWTDKEKSFDCTVSVPSQPKVTISAVIYAAIYADVFLGNK